MLCLLTIIQCYNLLQSSNKFYVHTKSCNMIYTNIKKKKILIFYYLFLILYYIAMSYSYLGLTWNIEYYCI